MLMITILVLFFPPRLSHRSAERSEQDGGEEVRV